MFETIDKKVSELKIGDKLDLEKDKYADPNGDESFYQSQYVEVIDIVEETPQCTVVSTEVDSVGFPPEHTVKVKSPE